MATYSKSALVKDVAEHLGTTDSSVVRVLDAVLAQVSAKANAGENVTLKGFGTFKIRESPARMGRNPSTGESIEIAASRRLTFKASKTRT